MPNSVNAAFLLASSLQAAHCELKSWRKVARTYYQDKVHFATLCRIANSEGEWLPKDRVVLRELGLIRPIDEHTKRVRREINRMAKETRKAMKVTECITQ